MRNLPRGWAGMPSASWEPAGAREVEAGKSPWRDFFRRAFRLSEAFTEWLSSRAR